MRNYTVLITRHGKYENFPGHLFSAPERIRHVVVAIYQEVFGLAPDFYWHQDGFMAEAMCHRRFNSRNSVEVQQINYPEVFRCNSTWTIHNDRVVPYIGPWHQLTQKEAA